MDKNETISDRLRRARALSGLSGRAISRLAGLRDESHVRVIENRPGSRVEAETALRLARVLGVTVEWLVEGVGREPTRESVARAVLRASNNQAA